MSGIAPISAQVSFSSGAVGGAAGLGGGADAASLVSTAAGASGPAGALGIQLASSLQAAGNSPTVDPMATLALALLMSKGSDSKDKTDPWQMLAALAMLGSAQGQATSFSFSMNMSVGDAYAASGAVTAAGMSAQA